MTLNNYTHALVRPPGNSFVHALAVNPQPIEVELARKQHAEYIDALHTANVAVEILPPHEGLPDSCFMQDPAMIVDGIAILNRMGAPSRFEETALVADILRARFETHALMPPASLEGGDVMIAGKRLLIGESERTNRAGIEQVCALLEPRGFTVQGVVVQGMLHLLTDATYVGNNVLVVWEPYANEQAFRDFEKVIVPNEEAYAANTLGIGKYVIMPAGFPKTQASLQSKGFEVLPVPMSEYYKADGGVSCLSLIW